ncbi:hypothetical protein [Streptomyces sp. NBC_00842]|uniref:hypothetical protein n=1 Tax=Streptomyces sp. NBC_00842 TaxID=2975848 RepID=UPI0038659A22|nr:hypothetical protein OH821_22000 [Streptomyces sp. NBC_00842]
MTDRPIIPTRIIPAGVPLPARGPQPGDIPPWRPQPAPTAAPPQPPAPAPAAPEPQPQPRPVQVYVTLQPAPYYEEPEPARRQRLWAWLTTIGRPWQICGALALALFPIPGVGYSVATIWASCVTEARDTWGQAGGYALALTPLTIAVIRITRSGGTLPRLLLLAVSLVGLTGAIHLYDPVTWITGVRP